MLTLTASLFTPLIEYPSPYDRENTLVAHREGAYVLLLMTAAALVTMVWHAAIRARFLWAISAIAIGAGAIALLSSLEPSRFVDACDFVLCAGPVAGDEYSTQEVPLDIALEVGATGGLLIVLGGLMLLLASVVRPGKLPLRPIRAHPHWM